MDSTNHQFHPLLTIIQPNSLIIVIHSHFCLNQKYLFTGMVAIVIFSNSAPGLKLYQSTQKIILSQRLTPWSQNIHFLFSFSSQCWLGHVKCRILATNQYSFMNDLVLHIKSCLYSRDSIPKYCQCNCPVIYIFSNLRMTFALRRGTIVTLLFGIHLFPCYQYIMSPNPSVQPPVVFHCFVI